MSCPQKSPAYSVTKEIEPSPLLSPPYQVLPLGAFAYIISLRLPQTPQGGHCWTHFTAEDNEAQGGKVPAQCQKLLELRCEPSPPHSMGGALPHHNPTITWSGGKHPGGSSRRRAWHSVTFSEVGESIIIWGDNSHTQFEMLKDVDLGLVGMAQRMLEVTTWLFLAQSLRQVRLNEILLDYSRDAALVVM